MQKPINGIHEFQSSISQTQREFFETLSAGQRPEVLFTTCSDSRIKPNLTTRTQPGELFIVRNAGNIVPPHDPFPGGEAATIQYAIAVLKVKDIMAASALAGGTLRLHGWVHKLDTGEVLAVDREQLQYMPSAEARLPEPAVPFSRFQSI